MHATNNSQKEKAKERSGRLPFGMALLLLSSLLPCVSSVVGSNETVPASDDNQGGEEDAFAIVMWFVLPSLFFVLFYGALSFAVWPYARPIVPFWPLILILFFPPMFPFLLFYLFFAFCFVQSSVVASIDRPPVVVVVERARGGRGGGIPSTGRRSSSSHSAPSNTRRGESRGWGGARTSSRI
jgi:hypothetical protein